MERGRGLAAGAGTLLALVCACALSGASGRYSAAWTSLDSRPLPQWYADAKFGVFVHWGVYSVPSFGNEWFWYHWKSNSSSFVDFMKRSYPPGFTYQDFAKEFKAEFYEPDQWAELFQSSGAKYVVLTSKHHEGYTLWPSRYSFSWNSKDVGPNRDLVGELASSIRRLTDLKFGLYHSLFEWYNPLYLQDEANQFKTQKFVDYKTLPELYELVETYRPEVVWSDGPMNASDSYWRSRSFLAWLYNDSPVKSSVVANDRWGKGVKCKHGDFYTCRDHYNPGHLIRHKWENCDTVDKNSWSFRRNARLADYHSVEELLARLVSTVSCNGNYLLNVAPTKEGVIPPVYEERLRQLGAWLALNGEAIYSTEAWSHQKDAASPGVWYTKSKDGSSVFALVLQWPKNNVLHLGSPRLSDESNVTLLGNNMALEWAPASSGIKVTFCSREDAKSDWAWALKLTNVTH
ncbi:alpha-L-fucosidase-like [Bacillus rossius redtenbacheri]|uniref:alpha-L-fucosidase-like n=1 Tax=Bacillus rossius redtenbacheri TaxID=93214 RepID=UPI002FDEA810